MTIEYSTKKTMVNGMLDVALMLSNASRLKTMLRQDCLNSIQCIVGVTFLILSIVLQIAIGIVLLILARREQRCRKRKKDCVESEADDKHNEADCDDEHQDELMEKDTEKKKKPLKRQLTIKEETDIMRKDKTTTKLNTAVLIAVFVVVVLNILMDGLDLGLPETEKTKA